MTIVSLASFSSWERVLLCSPSWYWTCVSSVLASQVMWLHWCLPPCPAAFHSSEEMAGLNPELLGIASISLRPGCHWRENSELWSVIPHSTLSFMISDKQNYRPSRASPSLHRDFSLLFWRWRMRLVALSQISIEYITHLKVLGLFILLIFVFSLDPETTKWKKIVYL